MKSKVVSKTLTVLAVGILSLSAMAEQGTPAMASIAQSALNTDEAGRMFKDYQGRELRQMIREYGTDDFDQSAIYCGRFMARRGLGRFKSSNERQSAGIVMEVLTSDIRIFARDYTRGTVRVEVEGNCYADNSGEIQRFNVLMDLNLNSLRGTLLKETLVMTLDGSD